MNQTSHARDRRWGLLRIACPEDVPPAIPVAPEPVTLTPIPERDERCEACSYPERCATDRTCWRDVTFERKVNLVGPRGPWEREEALEALRAYAASHDGYGPKTANLRPPELPPQMTLLGLFGSMKAAFLAAGIEAPKRRRSFNKWQYEDRALDLDPDAA